MDGLMGRVDGWMEGRENDGWMEGRKTKVNTEE